VKNKEYFEICEANIKEVKKWREYIILFQVYQGYKKGYARYYLL
jgi:hypothetical protein